MFNLWEKERLPLIFLPQSEPDLDFFNHLDSTYFLLFPLNSCREWPHCIKTSPSMWKYPWALFRHSDLCQSTKQAISRFCFSNPSNHANPICIYRTFCPSFLSQRWHNSDWGHAVFRETLDLLYVSLDFDVREDQRELERRERESKSRREGRGQQSREGWEWQRKKVSMRWEVVRERERAKERSWQPLKNMRGFHSGFCPWVKLASGRRGHRVQEPNNSAAVNPRCLTYSCTAKRK